MKAQFKCNQKVTVKPDSKTPSFTGVIEQVMHWENPFSILKKKGIDYAVRADDDNELYKCDESELSKL